MTTALVTGAGGFIGGHLARYLKAKGYTVYGADLRLPEYGKWPGYYGDLAERFAQIDLRSQHQVYLVFKEIQELFGSCDEVYHLAADMGGIGYITADHANISRNNARIDLNMLEAAQETGVKRFFYASSACVYPAYRQDAPDVPALSEDMAEPAQPEEGYGWEKLFAEKLCRYYREELGLETRIARFHNIYGPYGTYDGGKEKAPAAICRKVAQAPGESDGWVEIEVWGDGRQTRSFCYINDCVEGIWRIMQSGYPDPLNLGSEEMVEINQLVDLVAEAAGRRVPAIKRYRPDMPQGVRGRCSDNTRILRELGWAPTTLLRDGLPPTYRWIENRVRGG